MLMQKLTNLQKQQIIDTLEASELVDYLSISTSDVVETFEDLILDNLEELEDIIGCPLVDKGYDEDENTRDN